MSIKELIKKLPYPVAFGLKYVYSLLPVRFRYGKLFWESYKFLKYSQWWSREKLEEYQMEQLNKLLKHSFEFVPYYRKIFKKSGISIEDIKILDDLKKLPYLTRENIQENLLDLIAKNYPKSMLKYVTTGGSTGMPLGFYEEKETAWLREWAFIINLWERVGYKIGDRCVVLRGNVIKSAQSGRFWEYDPVKNNLILSSYHIKESALPEYIEKIREFSPLFIQSYPSVITILARFMKENDIKPFPELKAILCTSENIYDWQRALLEEVFRCRVYSFYGHTEKVALAGECEKSTCYHIQPEYGIVELIDKDGKPLTKDNEVGEIVATGFNNYVCPFIRYRTGDLGVFTSIKCVCGRNFSLLKKVLGRIQEFVVTEDKRLIPFTALIFAQHFGAFSTIKEMQFIQEEEGKLLIRVVKTTRYSNEDEEELRSKIQNATGGGLRIEFDYVDSIPRTERGKYRLFIQKLPISFGDKC